MTSAPMKGRIFPATHDAIERVVELIRAAAMRGEKSPSNVTLAEAIGIRATASVVRYIRRAEQAGLIVVKRGNSSRVIEAPDGSWRTAGIVERKHWRVRTPEERGKAPDTRKGPRVVKAPSRQKGAAGYALAIQRTAPQPQAPAIMPKPRFVPGMGWAGNKNGCCWPMWGDREAPTHVHCEAPRAEIGKPYCAQHAAVARRDGA